MASVAQAEKGPAKVVREGVEGLMIIESSRAIAGVILPPNTRQNVSTLLSMDSKMLDAVGNFVKPIASTGIGVGMAMKALGNMINLI